MGVPMHYGTCEGGPFNNKQMAHAEPVYCVAIDEALRKAHPGMQSSRDPAIKFGEYQFDGKAWQWTAAASFATGAPN